MALTKVKNSITEYNVGATGQVSRGFEDKMSDWVSAKDFGAVGDGVTNDTTALQAWITHITTNGLTGYLPAGDYYKPNTTAGLSWTGSLHIMGAGMYQSVIKFDDDAGAGRSDCFKVEAASPCTNMHLEHIGIESTWGDGADYTQRSHLLEVVGTGNAEVHHCRFSKSRYMATVLGSFSSVNFSNNVYEETEADGARATSCKNVVVHGNYFRNVNDDAVAIHTKDVNSEPVNGLKIVTNNRLEECQGITVLGAKQCTINNNVITRPHTRAILVGAVQTPTSTEGNTVPLAINITGNIITDLFDGSTFSGSSGSSLIWIKVRNHAPKAGSAAGYVGEPDGSGGIVEPWPYMYTNDIDETGITSAGNWQVIVKDNQCVRTLDVATNYSDYGYGTRLGRSGPVDPAITSSDIGGDQIEFLQHLFAGRIEGNVCSGGKAGIVLRGDAGGAYKSWHNVQIVNNSIVNQSDGGIYSIGKGTIDIRSNFLDGDPFHVHPYRLANGKWDGNYGLYTPIWIETAYGVCANNTFKNWGQIYRGPSLNNFRWENNALYCKPTFPGTDANNQGIRNVYSPGRIGYIVVEDSDPASATYGAIDNICVNASDSMPSSGWYVEDHFVRNTTSTVLGAASSQYIILGWQRLTTGPGHVLNTDWVETRALTGT
jgi:hypothetical protein